MSIIDYAMELMYFNGLLWMFMECIGLFENLEAQPNFQWFKPHFPHLNCCNRGYTPFSDTPICTYVTI